MPTRPQAPDAASGVQRAWHPCESHHGDQAVLQELATAIKHPPKSGTLTRAELEMRAAEVRALIREAERGDLAASSWKPVSRDPDLWELRWNWKPAGTLLRAYFHEPPQPSDRTVVAKVHVKSVKGSRRAINDAQDVQIDEATHRIAVGLADRWGLAQSRPLYPAG